MAKEKSRVLILPKKDKDGVPYLSYSQVSKWLSNKREYIRQYFFGEAFEGNAYTDFGSKVGEALENNDFRGFTAAEKKFLKTIPRYDEFEREIKLQMDGFYVKGYIDTNSSLKERVIDKDTTGMVINDMADYKTGDIEKKTEEYESEKYNQLEIYAAAIQKETGHIPDNVSVILIGRKGNPFKPKEPLKLTRKFATITRKVDQAAIDRVLKEVQEAAEEISEAYQVFLKLKGGK